MSRPLAQRAEEPWREVHRKLKRIAKRRSALDCEELRLIREAIVLCVWRPLGMTSIREYLEVVLGYGPGVASERVRVAEALDAMPALERALDTGELPYSAIREITRVATRKTEETWITACRGKNLREIEELLAEREPGDRPDSPRKPDLRMRDLKFKVRPATEANVRLARKRLEGERGERLDEDELLDAMAQAVLACATGKCAACSDGQSQARGGGRSRAPAQIAITICRDCGVARQAAAGKEIALRPDELDHALCDAEWIDVEGGGRARQDITPAVRKIVKHRDGDRCRVPGCRSARNVDVHHIVHRAQGGTHDPDNLIQMCSGHHKSHHRGELMISGTAVAAVFTWADADRNGPSTSHVGDGGGPGSTSHVGDGVGAGSTSHVEDGGEADMHSHAGDGGGAGSTSHVGDGDGVDSTFHAVPAVEIDSSVGNDVRAEALLALETLGFTRREARTAVDRALASHASIRDLEGLIRAALRQCHPGS